MVLGQRNLDAAVAVAGIVLDDLSHDLPQSLMAVRDALLRASAVVVGLLTDAQ